MDERRPIHARVLDDGTTVVLHGRGGIRAYRFGNSENALAFKADVEEHDDVRVSTLFRLNARPI